MTCFGGGGVSPFIFHWFEFFWLGFWGAFFFFFTSFPLSFLGNVRLSPANYQMMAEFHWNCFCDFCHLSSVGPKQSTKNVCIFWLQKLGLKAKQNKRIVRLKLQKLCQRHKNHRAPFKLLFIQLLPNRILDRGNRIFMPANPFVIASKYKEAYFTTITVCPTA